MDIYWKHEYHITKTDFFVISAYLAAYQQDQLLKMLLIKDEYNLLLQNFLMIVLYNSSANCWLGVTALAISLFILLLFNFLSKEF